ncbi:unnamed protein product [Rotaria sordida]|uniref:Uncharacterized protein n=1 Tax=Rotaria sordida TaxID=392033 RepID=A0A819DM09_9BILA|nr:unnamed protein product [Rotaria sordida]CAF3837325.1 unnamed protein product [Rotaria sordida]
MDKFNKVDQYFLLETSVTTILTLDSITGSAHTGETTQSCTNILKYCFNMNLTREEVERISRKKLRKKREPVIQRFVYVNAPRSSKEAILTVGETIV